MATRKAIADRDEILKFLTSVMRSDELSEKDRLGAAFKLGRYLGLETGDGDSGDIPRVIIYDGTAKNKLS
ncbi:MAG: hypothetical protein J6N15_02825 [Ruminiclostridium sp.]|nr:hypothetical protein [Ruminiclostridium sp.]